MYNIAVLMLRVKNCLDISHCIYLLISNIFKYVFESKFGLVGQMLKLAGKCLMMTIIISPVICSIHLYS